MCKESLLYYDFKICKIKRRFLKKMQQKYRLCRVIFITIPTLHIKFICAIMQEILVL